MKLIQSKFHFVGIGGIGMCGLAELLHNMGATVSGSDVSSNKQTDHLSALGIQVYKGHKAEYVGEADVLVYSSAVKSDNPEVLEAKRKKIPRIPRAEALAEMMLLKRGVAVGGTHGKTTTTSLVAAIFLEAQLEPTIVVGGRLDLIKSTARLGSGEWLIAEADESDGSFLKLNPEFSIITNIDNDHLDHYKTIENVKQAFYEFALKIPFYGAAVVYGDDPEIRKVFEGFPKRIVYYGFDEKNDYVIKGNNSKYSVSHAGECLGTFQLHVPGRHNALNALSAIIVGLLSGISFQICVQGLLKFRGVDRRFQFIGEKNGVSIYDDYGHHPTEVKAVLSAFKEKFPDRRICVFFQPHRYSRTQICWLDFLTAFKDADVLWITDIYAAGEAPIAQVSSEALAHGIDHKCCAYLKSENVDDVLLKSLKAGDIFITLGAGDGWKVGQHMMEKL